MTTVAVLAEPPVEGAVLDSFVDGPLDAGEAVELYTAMVRDVCRAVEDSGGELLVNYRPAEQVAADVEPEQRLRDVLEPALTDPDEARYEVQVGETFAGRVGNTVTYLLEQEQVNTVAAVDPTAALLSRQRIDSAAMKLRSSEVVLGPSTEGRVYYAAFAEPVDFEDAYATPAIETLTDRGRAADLSVDFLPSDPVLARPDDLRSVLPLLNARRRAERLVPPRTVDCLADLGLALDVDGDDLTVVRRTDRP
ncbi:hypothetical protein ACFQL1_01395 [Halomicroarcula sp. GCM10025709]|uniref:hypothetical protein n=1 Tax=Haloarcula TaxID=2237 RepID=UPI0024C32C73|nr:hypothetical protein [Halomicroarcula sp. YJ-61-S]